METIRRFNIRVYGILIEDDRILLVDEHYMKREMTKFPGGGLNPGEGTIECLKREIKEELNMEVEVKDHLYTTDFFQRSIFKETDQVFSIYYFIERKHKNSPINFNWLNVANEHKIRFHWADLKDFTVDMLTFPIDKKVGEMILSKFKP
ncbi:MAG TPA: NUDIX domain-containing protein [Bacteroidia bacterium]|nr:NUDIX domain-containing protein [Bacteroidia bacterium]